MTMPPATALPSFYKIAPNNPITFGWNFTSLYVQPTSLTVKAVCTQNGFTYLLGQNSGVIPGTATSIVWDPYQMEQSPGAQKFAQATYTLHIIDDRGDNAAMKGGLFSPNDQLRFALYQPGAATPLSREYRSASVLQRHAFLTSLLCLAEWNCPDCNQGGAAALKIHPGMFTVTITLMVMLLSGFGLLRRGFMVAR